MNETSEDTKSTAAVHTSVHTSPSDVVIGVLLGVDAELTPLVAYPGSPSEAGLPARTTVQLTQGDVGAVKAATAIRVAVSHYIVRGDDGDQFLAQLRHAVGIKAPVAED